MQAQHVEATRDWFVKDLFLMHLRIMILSVMACFGRRLRLFACGIQASSESEELCTMLIPLMSRHE